MIEWSLDALRACEPVCAIVVAVPPGPEPDLGGGDLQLVAGGATRAESVANALAAVETELVAIHDAARPLLTPELVDALVADLAVSPDAAGVIAAAPIADTVKRAAAEQPPTVAETLDRSLLWAAQTPQVFRVGALRAALADAAPAPDAATDEAMLVEAAGGTVLIHAAPAANFKVTTPHDLRVAELLMAERRAGGPISR